MTSRQSLAHYAHTGNIRRPSPLKMALSCVEKPSLSLCWKGRGITATPPVPSMNQQNPVVCSWMCLLARHKQGHRRSSLALWDLHPVQGPECCSTPKSNANSIPPMEGTDYLICGDFYSKMVLIWCLPSGQSNTVKVISLLKEMFSEHGIPKVLCSDNSPQYVRAQFTEFCISWGITHETSSPYYLQSNGFAKACVKSMKHALQCTKYSGTDPQLALLVLWATCIDAKLPSPAELLYQCQIRTTIPARICNTNLAALQICKWIDAHSDASKSQADKWCKSLAPPVCWSAHCNVQHPL